MQNDFKKGDWVQIDTDGCYLRRNLPYQIVKIDAMFLYVTTDRPCEVICYGLNWFKPFPSKLFALALRGPEVYGFPHW